jgi:putative oxidoreductase
MTTITALRTRALALTTAVAASPTSTSAAIVVIRLYVGLIFAGEGLLKFTRPETLGTGRFASAFPTRRCSPTSTARARSPAAL